MQFSLIHVKGRLLSCEDRGLPGVGSAARRIAWTGLAASRPAGCFPVWLGLAWLVGDEHALGLEPPAAPSP